MGQRTEPPNAAPVEEVEQSNAWSRAWVTGCIDRWSHRQLEPYDTELRRLNALLERSQSCQSYGTLPISSAAGPHPPADSVTIATGSGDDIARCRPLTITPHAQVRLFLVACKTLERTESRAIAADQRAGRIGGDALVSTGLDELPYP